MLDIKKTGIKIASLRKSIGYSQEKLAELLCISPQAISKWENGHALPDTALLPVLAQIFECSIDDIIMPAYSLDEKIEEKKPNLLELQAEHIAKQVITKMQDKIISKEAVGLSDDIIESTFLKKHGYIGAFTIHREKPSRTDGKICTRITVSTSKEEIKLMEIIYKHHDIELRRYDLLNKYAVEIPCVYYTDSDKKTILIEDLTDNYIKGCDYNENNENGTIIRANYNSILYALAKFHSIFWENQYAISQIGLMWHHETKENMLAGISSMEKDFKKYRGNEEAGKIPKIWEDVPQCGSNNIDKKQLDYFEYAINYLRENYEAILDSRFHTCKNITAIHGDLHPGQTYISKSEGRKIKFAGLQAVRTGFCTEDLAMLLALHIEPDKKSVKPLLEYYYNCLSEKITGYSYETFINDYKISIAENMFFTIRLINKGIFDFHMRDKAINAFETFIL